MQAAGDSDCNRHRRPPPPSLVRARDLRGHPARTVPSHVDGPLPVDLDRGRFGWTTTGSRPAQKGTGRGVTSQPFSRRAPLAVLGGRRPTCKGHAPTYTSYTAGGLQPRVYNASIVTIRPNAERMPVRLTRPAPKISAFHRFAVGVSDPGCSWFSTSVVSISVRRWISRISSNQVQPCYLSVRCKNTSSCRV